MFHVVCLPGLKVFGGQNENLCTNPSIKSPSSLIMLLSVSSVSNTMQDILLQSRQSWKWNLERFLREDNIIVQSRDQASKILDPEQSCSSSQLLCHYVLALLLQDRVILRAVRILSSNEIQSPSKSFHNQWVHRAKTLGPPPVRRLSRPKSNTRSEIDFFEYNCEKLWILLWGKVEKCSLEG